MPIWRRSLPTSGPRSDAYFEGGYWLQLWDFFVYRGRDVDFCCAFDCQHGCGTWLSVVTRFQAAADRCVLGAVRAGGWGDDFFRLRFMKVFFRGAQVWALQPVRLGSGMRDQMVRAGP